MSTQNPSGETRRTYTGGKRRRRRRRSSGPFLLLILVFVIILVVVLLVKGRKDVGGRGESSMPISDLASLPSSSIAVMVGGELDNNSSLSSNVPSQVEPNEPSTTQGTNDPMAAAGGDWRLVLVNATNKLEQDYDVKLAPIEGNFQLDARIIPDMRAMLDAAKADGVTLVVYSAYRPMARSRELYENKVREYIAGGYSTEAAQTEAAKWIAPPGTSEHNTGLSADLISGDYFTKFSDLVHEFDTCPEFAWLYENCAKYGFILRYPQDKQDITGITYEPWHYRYVGKENAEKIMNEKICLEEFLSNQSPKEE